jgi:uncharacterized repeat protein (TIGR01451 family)
MLFAKASNPVDVSLLVFKVNPDGTLIPAQRANPGDQVLYRLKVHNADNTTLPVEAVVVTAPIPSATMFIPNSATISLEWRLFEESDRLVWKNLVPFEPNQVYELEFRVVVKKPRPQTNEAGIVRYEVSLPPGCKGFVTMALGNATEQREVNDGWFREFVASPRDHLYLSVQNSCDSGTVGARIYINDELTESAVSTGAYVIATASDTY